MNLRYLKWPVALTFLLYPVYISNLQRSAHACFYLLVSFALVGIAWCVKPLEKSFTQILRKHWQLVLAMTSMVHLIKRNAELAEPVRPDSHAEQHLPIANSFSFSNPATFRFAE